MSTSSTVPARLYDGVRARAVAGTVAIDGDALEFRREEGGVHRWPLLRVLSIHRVAGELHVELAAAAGPARKLVVGDPRFEQQLDDARGRFAGAARVGAGRWLRRSRLRTWLVVAAVVLPLAYLLATVALPHAHVLIGREAEAALGDRIHDSFVEPRDVVHDEEFAALAATMVAELSDPAAGFDVRVTLVRDAEANAFAAPGGRVVVFTGLLQLCPSADALAGVLAHEIVHVEQRHGLKHLLRTLGLLWFAGAAVGGGVEEFATAETITEMSSLLLVLEHSREHEREADDLAARKLVRAGRRVAGLREFFEALQREMPDGSAAALGWLGTHPLTADRVAAAAAFADPVGARPWLPAAEWETLRTRLLRERKK